MFLKNSQHSQDGSRSPLPFFFFENRKKCLILEKNDLFVCICVLNYYLKCSFKSISEKKDQNFPLTRPSFLYTKRLSKCPYPKKPPLPWIIPGCAPGFPVNMRRFSKQLFNRTPPVAASGCSILDATKFQRLISLGII